MTLGSEAIKPDEFDVDAVYSTHELYITLECRECPYVGEITVPVDLAELNRRATEHLDACDG